MILYFILSTAVVLFLVVFQNFLRYFYESGNPLTNLWQYRPLFPRLLYPHTKPDWILGSAWTRYGLSVIEATNGFLIPSGIF